MSWVQDADDEAAAIVEAIKPLLAGRRPELQGLVLMDLLVTWLGGFIAPDDPVRTRELRAILLETHVTAVRELLAAKEEAFGVQQPNN